MNGGSDKNGARGAGLIETTPSEKPFFGPWRVLIVTSITIFVAEALVMRLLAILPLGPGPALWFGDALMLSVLTFPALYLFLFVPMLRYANELQRAGKALRESEERYRLLFREMVDAFALHEIICDKEGQPIDSRFLEVNPAFERITKLPARQVVGKTLLEVMPDTDPSLISAYGNVALTGESTRFEQYSPQMGKHFEVAAYSPRRNRFAVTFTDVTERTEAEQERRRLEHQVQQAQKTESLAVLAGGIAHDFNNLLTSVMGNADLALEDLSPVSPVRENIEEIERAAKRAAELSGQMLAYSGKGRFVVESIDLGELVKEMSHLLEASVSKKAALRYDLAENLPAIEADAAQIRQAIMSLATNASEALDGAGGLISIRTGAVECNRACLDETWLAEPLPEGAYVYLEVIDTGTGMDEETRGKVFDPFFTTKFPGRGLGLAAVLGIVRGHKGAITVHSEPGKGTTFRLFFPTIDQAPGRAVKQSSYTTNWRGSGAVLLVDDEETIRDVGARMLEKAGFTVLTARDGKEALDIYVKHIDEIVCVLLDLTMPRMDGEETLLGLRRIRDDVRVILSSGYDEQDIISRFNGKRLSGFIKKPYRPAHLNEKLREVLEQETASASERTSANAP